MSAGIVAQVGKYYMVPHMYTKCRGGWLPRDGWVPILGPKHEDAEHLNFPYQHFHIDWRFLNAAAYLNALGAVSGSPLGNVLTNTTGEFHHAILGEPVLKRRKCLRDMPIFPARPTDGWARMETAQGKACSKLKPGNICPHRGIDLTPFIQPDGTAICPGHGLRWDTTTGALLPRHAA